MVTKNQVLQALLTTSSRCPLKVKELTENVVASPQVLSVLLHRLSKEKLVAKKDIKRGWYITKQGKQKLQLLSDLYDKSLESRGRAFRMKHVEELEEAIRRAEGTDRGKFLELGKVAGVPPNLVLLVTDSVWNFDNFEDPKRLWNTFRQFGLRIDLARFWLAAWFSHLGKRITGELHEEIFGSS
jgi:hypothetical protein